jgi:2-C-methyl-D-erythritol 4-phosphate cytidylyltransferase/2-C-methyl-D-erythritol 2,4-cyclodiphosphate synthase
MREPYPTTTPDFTGVIVAAGRSRRFGTAVPKQFQDLGGRSVLERSVHALADRPAVGSVVVVLAAEEVDGPRGARIRNWPGVSLVVAGGASRAESVARGVAATGDARFVLVHDAARPLVSPRLVDDVIDAARRHGAAVPVVPIVDTVKETDDEGWVTRTLDRARLCRAQTPQGFRRDWLVAALERAKDAGEALTDEAAALERYGKRVAPVLGEPGNVKLTSPDDLDNARHTLLGAPDLRVGTGFDVHRFEDGRQLVLGGVVFEGERGLAGHSDADVVLHAGMDALLGAASLGDIGVHFPPSEARFAGAASTDLAEDVTRRVRDEGFEIVNLDLTVLAETPRIGARASEMRQAIGACLGLDPARIGVKATTMERLGALGRGEGIACQAACLLVRRGPRTG